MKKKSGPRNVDSQSREYSSFAQFSNDEVIDFLVQEMNEYNKQVIDKKWDVDWLSQFSNFRQWKDMNLAEMRAYCAISTGKTVVVFVFGLHAEHVCLLV